MFLTAFVLNRPCFEIISILYSPREKFLNLAELSICFVALKPKPKTLNPQTFVFFCSGAAVRILLLNIQNKSITTKKNKFLQLSKPLMSTLSKKKQNATRGNKNLPNKTKTTFLVLVFFFLEACINDHLRKKKAE